MPGRRWAVQVYNIIIAEIPAARAVLFRQRYIAHKLVFYAHEAAAPYGLIRLWRHKVNCPAGAREGPLGVRQNR